MDVLLSALRQAWADPTLRRGRIPGLPPYRTIAGSEQDQIVRVGATNPLWEVVRQLPAAPGFYGSLLQPQVAPMAFESTTMARLCEMGADRHGMCTRFAWSIITPGDVTWMTRILDGRAVVEIGAGSGYWAWQLQQAGVDVVAYDPHPVGDNKYAQYGPYTPVLDGDALAVKRHQDRVLLMVWPPYGGAHAHEALSAYEGDLLIYAGEGWGGCTADDDFCQLLDSEWEEESVSPAHVTWSGIHCQLAAYRRKAVAP